MVDWKSMIYTRVMKSEADLEAPEDFDEWLEKRMKFVKDSGQRLISEENEETFYEYYRGKKTLQAIGDEHGVTRENIRQRNERTIKNLIEANKRLTPKEWFYKNGSVFDLPMSPRAMNCIYQNQITTMKQLDQMLSDGSLKKLRNIGNGTVKELMAIMTDWKIMQEESAS